MTKELGTAIGNLRRARGISQQDLADAINKDRTTVTMYEKGTRNPPLKVMQQIAAVLGTSLDELTAASQPVVYDQIDIKTSNGVPGTQGQVKVYNELKRISKPRNVLGTPDAASVIPVVGNVWIERGKLQFGDFRGWATAEVSEPGDYFYWRCTRDAMAPSIQPGDLLLCHIQDDVDSGDLAIVIRKGMGGRLCRVQKHEQGIVMLFDNPQAEPVDVSTEDSAIIAGKVKRLVRVYE